MDIFYITVEQIVKFSLMIALGVVCVKCKVLNQTGLDALSRLILRVLMPIYILHNVTSGATRADVLENFYILPLTFGIYGMLCVVAWLLCKLFGLPLNQGKTYQAVLVFGNIGFMGIPLITAVFPEKGMVYIALYAIVDQLMVWTYCVHLTTKDSKGISFGNLKRMVNPALIAIVTAIVLVMCQVQLPTVLTATMASLGTASSPLSLVYIGACLAYCDLRHVLGQKELYVGILVKMFCLPLLTYFVLYQGFGLAFDVSMTMAMIVALPSMITTPMLVTMNNPDQGEYAIGAVMLTQLSCMALMPLLSYCITVFG